MIYGHAASFCFFSTQATCRFEIQTSRDSTGESEWLNTPCRSGLLRRLLEPVPEKRITVEEILKDPWFNHGVDPSEIVGVQIDDYDLEEETKRVRVDRVVVHPESRRLVREFCDAGSL